MDDKTYIKHSANYTKLGINWDDPIAVAEYQKRYYEEHKKSQARKSTSGLNEEGRNLASFVKEGINQERDQKIDTSKSNRDANINKKQEYTTNSIDQKRKEKEKALEDHKEAMNNKINSLQSRLEHMSSYDKKIHKEEIKNEIARLREENSNKRLELNDQFKSDSTNLRNDLRTERTNQNNTHTSNIKKYREEADERYLNALDKIKADSRYQKATKASTKTSTKKSTKTSNNTTSGSTFKFTKNNSSSLKDRVVKNIQAKRTK